MSDPTWSLLVDCEKCHYPISAAGAQAFHEERTRQRRIARGAALTRDQLDAVHIHANRVEREAEAAHRRGCPHYAALRDRMEAKAARDTQRTRQKGRGRPLVPPDDRQAVQGSETPAPAAPGLS